jgi:hypothetical protein
MRKKAVSNALTNPNAFVKDSRTRGHAVGIKRIVIELIGRPRSRFGGVRRAVSFDLIRIGVSVADSSGALGKLKHEIDFNRYAVRQR